MTKCPAGQILRKGYHRAAYRRTDGVEVAAADVAPTCIDDRGKPGKLADDQKKITWGDEIVLSEVGYSIKLPAPERRAALERACQKWDPTDVMLNLNAKRNINPKTSRTHRIMSSDVEWLKKYLERLQKAGGEEDRENIQYQMDPWRVVATWHLTSEQKAELSQAGVRDTIWEREDSQSFLTLLCYLDGSLQSWLLCYPTPVCLCVIFWSMEDEQLKSLLWAVEQIAISRGDGCIEYRAVSTLYTTEILNWMIQHGYRVGPCGEECISVAKEL